MFPPDQKSFEFQMLTVILKNPKNEDRGCASIHAEGYGSQATGEGSSAGPLRSGSVGRPRVVGWSHGGALAFSWLSWFQCLDASTTSAGSRSPSMASSSS